MNRVIVHVPAAADRRWKSWRRRITGIDPTKGDGWAFQGAFLDADRLAEFHLGDLVLLYDEVGSHRHHEPHVEVKRILLDRDSGKAFLATCADQHGDLTADGWSWALKLRDRTAAQLSNTADNTLAENTEPAELAAMLRRVADQLDEGWDDLNDLGPEVTSARLRRAADLLEGDRP